MSQLASIALIKCNGLDRPRVSEKDVRFRRVIWGEAYPTRINNNDTLIRGIKFNSLKSKGENMTNRELRIWNDLRPFSVGFDNLFNHFNLHLDNTRTVNYPPYNIVEVDNFNWKIEMALAGFGKKDINIEYANNLLTVESVKDEDTKEVEENDGVLFKGISKRQFKKSFTVADDVVINGAELKDGMLVIDLEKIVPEEKKPRTIKIK